MAAPPMPYRAPKSSTQQYVASFPPPVYYRDTFGLQPVVNERNFTDSIASECSDDSSSMATKSTVKTTMNIFHAVTNNYPTNHMQESQYTDVTQQSHLQVEEILTNQVLILHARLLLILSLVAFGSAVQLLGESQFSDTLALTEITSPFSSGTVHVPLRLESTNNLVEDVLHRCDREAVNRKAATFWTNELVFSVICLFFDGAPYYICLIASIWFMCCASILLFFIRRQHSRQMLATCLICTSVSIVVCALLFFWTTILIHGEDELIRNEDQLLLSLSLNATGEHPKSHAAIRAAHELKAANHIIRNTRMTMYSLHLVFSLIQGACCAAILYILYRNQRSLIDGKTVLVPITLKQVRGKITNPNDEEEDEIDSTSIGVQTSGGYVGTGGYSRRGDML